jgi:sulfate transport system substrate-binding protein
MPGVETERGDQGAWWRSILLSLVALAAILLLVWVGRPWSWLESPAQPQVVVLYCFSTLDDVMQERLLPAFRREWERETGQAVELVATFAGSGDITSRILAEVTAEIAIVSSELDAYRLPAPWRSWRELPHGGVLVRTPLVIAVRDGNPKGLQGFADLAGQGLALVHGDPETSGAAQLAILAEYASARRRGGDGEAAFRQLLATWRNVTVRPPTAREARRRFEAGEGDALVSYEADLIGSPSRARVAGEIVHPASTIVAEPVVVKIEKNIDERRRRAVDALVEFLWTREAQQILVEYGFESVYDELNVARPGGVGAASRFTLAEVGGATARREILDKVWRDRVVPELRR